MNVKYKLPHCGKSAGLPGVKKDTCPMPPKPKKKGKKGKKKGGKNPNVDKDGFPKPPPGWGKPIKMKGRNSPGAKQRRNKRR